VEKPGVPQTQVTAPKPQTIKNFMVNNESEENPTISREGALKSHYPEKMKKLTFDTQTKKGKHQDNKPVNIPGNPNQNTFHFKDTKLLRNSLLTISSLDSIPNNYNRNTTSGAFLRRFEFNSTIRLTPKWSLAQLCRSKLN
jgi:hypothetical protein